MCVAALMLLLACSEVVTVVEWAEVKGELIGLYTTGWSDGSAVLQWSR